MSIEKDILVASAALVGALSALIPAILSWMKTRDEASKAKLKLDAVKSEMEFITSWYKASDLFSGQDVEDKKEHAKLRFLNILDESDFTEKAKAEQAAELEKPSASLITNIALIFYGMFYFVMVLGSMLNENGSFDSSQMTADGNFVFLAVLAVPFAVIFYFRQRSIKKKLLSIRKASSTE